GPAGGRRSSAHDSPPSPTAEADGPVILPKRRRRSNVRSSPARGRPPFTLGHWGFAQERRGPPPRGWVTLVHTQPRGRKPLSVRPWRCRWHVPPGTRGEVRPGTPPRSPSKAVRRTQSNGASPFSSPAGKLERGFDSPSAGRGLC